ncbi:hypothetical protein EGI20_05675 [Aquitalea sp. S1-19]|nr:hypothetical protein [Aquitalea sp. S1-19]
MAAQPLLGGHLRHDINRKARWERVWQQAQAPASASCDLHSSAVRILKAPILVALKHELDMCTGNQRQRSGR